MGELTQCEICFETLKDPRMLHCQHTFCLSCLHSNYEYATIDNKWKCPTCNREYKIDNKEMFDEMPTNVYIESIFQLLNENSNASPKFDIRCVKCQTVCQFQEQICQHCRQVINLFYSIVKQSQNCSPSYLNNSANLYCVFMFLA